MPKIPSAVNGFVSSITNSGSPVKPKIRTTLNLIIGRKLQCVGTESIYVRLDEVHDGTKYDPIPYGGNMALESGKYYAQGGVTFRCTRGTGNAVFQPLAELAGIYVEIV